MDTAENGATAHEAPVMVLFSSLAIFFRQTERYSAGFSLPAAVTTVASCAPRRPFPCRASRLSAVCFYAASTETGLGRQNHSSGSRRNPASAAPRVGFLRRPSLWFLLFNVLARLTISQLPPSSGASLTIATSEPQHQRSTVSQSGRRASGFGTKEAPELGIHATSH